MSTVVTNAVASRYTDMINAAAVSSRRVLRIRAASRCWRSAPAPRTSGIMLTPVSKPDRPRTSSGKASTAGPSTAPNPPPPAVSAAVQSWTAAGSAAISARPAATITALSARKTTTSGTATSTASLNPSRNTPPRTSSSATVTSTAVPVPCGADDGRYGFSSRCTVASAADRVIVTIHEVATKPSSTSTKSLPRQNGSSRSSIATDPCPCGLSRATRRYIGSIPNRVSATISRVASGESAPAASAAIPGR